VRKTNLMRQIEARFPGEDICQIVKRVTSETPTPEAAAAELGISIGSLYAWRQVFADAEERQPAGVSA
jgi:hypothetical protein